MKEETVINQTNQIGSGNNNNNNNQNLLTKPQQKDITINSTGPSDRMEVSYYWKSVVWKQMARH